MAALDAWLQALGITAGALFRAVRGSGSIGANRLSDRDVARIVKRAVKASGIDEKAFAGHSLRASFSPRRSMPGRTR